MNRKELIKRYCLFIVSLFFSAFGVAITKHGELGVSPISSVANVMSFQFSSLSLGVWLIIWNCALVLGQILILRRKFQLIQLLQIPLSFLFGYFTDLGMRCASYLPAATYASRLLCVLSGTVILGFGISLAVAADVIMNSGEAFVKAIADQAHKNFGNVKIGFDICCVIGSVLLSLWFFDGQIIGPREGTVFTALFTGITVKFFVRVTNDRIRSLLIR